MSGLSAGPLVSPININIFLRLIGHTYSLQELYTKRHQHLLKLQLCLYCNYFVDNFCFHFVYQLSLYKLSLSSSMSISAGTIINLEMKECPDKGSCKTRASISWCYLFINYIHSLFIFFCFFTVFLSYFIFHLFLLRTFSFLMF